VGALIGVRPPVRAILDLRARLRRWRLRRRYKVIPGGRDTRRYFH
jgi:hypothetical protein